MKNTREKREKRDLESVCTAVRSQKSADVKIKLLKHHRKMKSRVENWDFMFYFELRSKEREEERV